MLRVSENLFFYLNACCSSLGLGLRCVGNITCDRELNTAAAFCSFSGKCVENSDPVWSKRVLHTIIAESYINLNTIVCIRR